MLEPPGQTAMVATAQLPTPMQEETWKDDKSYTTEIGQLLNIRELRSPTFTALRTGGGGGWRWDSSAGVHAAPFV